MDRSEGDGAWVWVAFDPERKAVLAHHVGERKQRSADKLVGQVKERVTGVPSFCSDGLCLYRSALLKFYGRTVPFPRTGKRGRPRKPALVPDENLRYAQVIKHRRNGHLAEVEKRQVFGKDGGPESISTSGVKRCNLTVRQENKRWRGRRWDFLKAGNASTRT